MEKYDFSYLDGHKISSLHEFPGFTEIHYSGAVATVYDKDEVDLISRIISDAFRIDPDNPLGYVHYYLINPDEYIG